MEKGQSEPLCGTQSGTILNPASLQFSALLATSSVETEGVHLWSCPGSRPSPTPSPALYFLLMKYAWRTDVPAPSLLPHCSLTPRPPQGQPPPPAPKGFPDPSANDCLAWLFNIDEGAAWASQWRAGGVCVYLHIYTHIRLGQFRCMYVSVSVYECEHECE